MQTLKLNKAPIFAAVLMLLPVQATFAQTGSLTLSSGTAGANGAVSLTLNLTGAAGSQPAAIQWTFTYPQSNVVSISASPGSATSSAGKTLNCASSPGTYRCIVSGMNASVIANGTIAAVNLTMAASAASTPIGIANSWAASPGGAFISLSATGGTVTGPGEPVSSLLAAYAFEEGAGSTLSDASGNGIIGQLQNAVWTTSGKNGKGLSFNGTTSYVDLGNTPTLRTTGSMTWSAWVYAAGNPADDGQIIALSDDTAGWQFKTTPDTGSRTFGVSVTGPGASRSQRYSRTILSLNTWYYVAGVYNATARTLDIYVNGVLDNGVLTGTVPASQTLPTVNAAIGRRTGGFYFNGVIDDLRVYDRALSVSEIQADMSTPVGATAGLPVLSSMQCSLPNLTSGLSTNCTVRLTKAAPTGGAAVALSDNSAQLNTPASITVGAGSTSATFSVSAGTILLDLLATITATYNGSSVNTVLNLLAPAQVSSLACNPASLGQNSSSTCTVTLSRTLLLGGSVALSSSNTRLSVPASVTVPIASRTATFNATTTTIPSDQSAIITATYAGSSANTTISLVTTARISSLTCNPASLGPGASSTCTVTLTRGAPAGGANVALSDNSGLLSTPASVTVAASATAATFNVTAAGTISSDQNVTVTATYNSSSANTAISLVTAVRVSSLACNPGSLGPSASSTCTVTLTRGAPAGGANVALSDNSGLLSTPASVTVAASATTATFSVTAAGTISSNQNVTVTATYNSSSASATINLVTTATVTSLVCTPNGLMSGATSACVATLSRQAPAATTVTLSDNSSLLTIPSSIVVAAGSTNGSFSARAGSISANTSATVTARLGTSSQTATLTLWSTPALVSLTCSKINPAPGTNISCIVILSKTAGDIPVNLRSTNPAVPVPARITVPSGASSAVFTVAVPSSASGWAFLTASFNGIVKNWILIVSPAAGGSTTTSLQRLSCTPNPLTSGARGLCQITLDGVTDSGDVEIQISASPSVRVPDLVAARRGQPIVEFQVDAVEPEGGEGVVAVQLGAEVLQTSIAVVPDRSLPLRVPGTQFARIGREVQFEVLPSERSAVLSAESLPAGARFDTDSGVFQWTPDGSQIGSHEVRFLAVDSTGMKAAASVGLQVESGAPVVTAVLNAASRSRTAACSPGAMAAIEGRWLIEGDAASDPAGNSDRLAGARVWVNGSAVPILAASDSELGFLCPEAPPGATLEIVVETGHGSAVPVRTTAHAAAPGIFSLDNSGAGQGLVLLEGRSRLAMIRNHRFAAQPAQAGDRVIVYATGVDRMTNITARIGEGDSVPAAIEPVPNRPGLFGVAFVVPEGVQAGGNVRLSLMGDAPGGMSVETNPVNIAIESKTR